jgi:hypothetical protein
MIGLGLAFSITLVLGGLFSPVAAETQQAAKVARIGFLAGNLAALPNLREASFKDCVTLISGANSRYAAQKRGVARDLTAYRGRAPWLCRRCSPQGTTSRSMPKQRRRWD